MNAKEPHAAADYVLVRTSEEYRRLRDQAKVWEPATRRILEQVGLRQGMRCLDIGCGPGEVMRLMGEAVGSSGQIVGLDADARLGKEATEVLFATVGSHFSFVAGDVETMEDVDGAPFDVTYARLILIHVSDPVALLAKMYRWTKPGGCIIVQDYDMRSVDLHPRIETWGEMERVLFGVFEKAGKDARIGYKLPVHFVEAGLGAPDGTDVSGILLSLRQSKPMVRAVYSSLLPRALEMGITTQHDSDAFLMELEAAAANDEFHSLFWPLLIGAWKRKPAP